MEKTASTLLIGDSTVSCEQGPITFLVNYDAMFVCVCQCHTLSDDIAVGFHSNRVSHFCSIP